MKNNDGRVATEKKKYKSKKCKLKNLIILAKLDVNPSTNPESQTLKLVNASSESNNSGLFNDSESTVPNSGLQNIYDLLEWQWDQGKSLIMQQCHGTDVADLLDTLHLVKTENDALEAKLLKLQMKKNNLKAINARLKSSLSNMTTSTTSTNSTLLPSDVSHKNLPSNKVPISPCTSNQRKKLTNKKETEFVSQHNQFVPISPNVSSGLPNSQKSPVVTSSIITDIKQLPACISSVLSKNGQPGQTQIQLPLNQLQTFLSQANLGLNQGNLIFQQSSQCSEIDKSTLLTNTNSNQILNNKSNNNNNLVQAFINNTNFPKQTTNPIMLMVNSGQNNQFPSSKNQIPVGIENKHIEDANRLLQVTQKNFTDEINMLPSNCPSENVNLEQMKLSKTVLNCLSQMPKTSQKSYHQDQNFVNYAKSFMTNSNSFIQKSDKSNNESDRTHSDPKKSPKKGDNNNAAEIEEFHPLIECVSPDEEK